MRLCTTAGFVTAPSLTHCADLVILVMCCSSIFHVDGALVIVITVPGWLSERGFLIGCETLSSTDGTKRGAPMELDEKVAKLHVPSSPSLLRNNQFLQVSRFEAPSRVGTAGIEL